MALASDQKHVYSLHDSKLGNRQMLLHVWSEVFSEMAREATSNPTNHASEQSTAAASRQYFHSYKTFQLGPNRNFDTIPLRLSSPSTFLSSTSRRPYICCARRIFAGYCIQAHHRHYHPNGIHITEHFLDFCTMIFPTLIRSGRASLASRL